MPIIRSISGIRATLNDGLRPDILTKYVAAYCNSLPNGTIVVGRDGRPSGNWIIELVIATISACGRKVIHLGICPTPTVQLITEKTDAVGGISITASHNPEMWNGLKFLNSEGVFLNQEENNSFWDLFDDDKIEYSKEPNNRTSIINVDSIDKHIKAITESDYFEMDLIRDYFRSKNYKVVIDAVNASGSLFVPKLLQEFGCDVIELFTDNSGIFPHTPEPLTENLVQLSETVRKNNADLGIAVDPDADRLVLIDEKGEPIGEEKTIAIAVKSVLSSIDKFKNGFNKTVVVNQSTSGVIEKIAKEFNVEVVRSAVGEINVVNSMKETKAIIGGEGSGGVILPHIHYGRDSLVGISLLLSFIQITNQSLSELSDSLPKAFIKKGKIEISGNSKFILDSLYDKYSNKNVSYIDGLRIVLNENDWVHIRASNTEPILRIIVESNTEARTNALYDAFENILQELL